MATQNTAAYVAVIVCALAFYAHCIAGMLDSRRVQQRLEAAERRQVEADTRGGVSAARASELRAAAARGGGSLVPNTHISNMEQQQKPG
ncbi:hypothetical protein cyc_04901 [Cyclospora cayetanensis]|uniref:Uncharacterized protein n=1 Tax=Cyclospora cayetanensis TaxID=88456 RepID=A0A1D3D9J8_9EIME|nr:hypothetical protein cyc_04901 [Cyclospora cayetanensis]